jgi:hypothetical protein
VSGEPISESTENVIANREKIENVIGNRLEAIREGQIAGAFEQGDSFSKEQETILNFITQYIQPNHGRKSAPVDEYETVEEWAGKLRERLQDVKLANTDEDRILRDRFRHNEKYDSLPDWPPTEFLKELEQFLEKSVEESTEYQSKLIGASNVSARLVCWGVVGR